MRSRDEKTAHAAHIKRRTEGTSNEISFSVLDLAKEKQGGDARTGRSGRSLRQRARALNKIGSPPLASTPSWETPAAEIAYRKSQRKRRKRIATSAIAVLTAAALTLALTALNTVLQARQSSYQSLTAAFEAVEETDEQAQGLDELVEGVIASLGDADHDELAASYDSQLAQAQAAKKTFAQQKEDIEGLQSGLSNIRMLEASNQALSFINARTAMISLDEEIMEEALPAVEAYKAAQQGWSGVLTANALVLEAAELIEDTSEDAFEASMKKTNEAIEEFEDARAMLVQVQDGYGVNLQVYLDYIDLRLEAQEQALISDQAYLDRDKETLADANASYNELENQAAELIQTVEGDPMAEVESVFGENTEDAIATYETQKAIAYSAHAFLLDYFGSNSK